MHEGFAESRPISSSGDFTFLPYAGINRIRFNGSIRSKRMSQAGRPPRGMLLV